MGYTRSPFYRVGATALVCLSFHQLAVATPRPDQSPAFLHQLSKRELSWYVAPSADQVADDLDLVLDDSACSDNDKTIIQSWFDDAIKLAQSGASALDLILSARSDDTSAWSALGDADKDRIQSNFDTFLGVPKYEQDQQGNIINQDAIDTYFDHVSKVRGMV
jgi:hypothetical protein